MLVLSSFKPLKLARHWQTATYLVTLCVSSLLISSATVAATPTAAQMAQFKSLPKAQQEQLARQYGVDLSALEAGADSRGDDKQPAPSTPTRIGGTDNATNVKRTHPADKDDDTQTLKPFGYDFLAGNSASINTFDDLPLPNDYLVGPGDTLDIQVFGKENQEYSLTVKRNGFIHFPKYGPMQVAGQTFGGVRAQIKAMFAERVIGVDVSVDIGAMRTMQVYLSGDVNQPGAYNVNGLTTITQALLAGGGIKPSGSLRNIQLKRNGKVIAELDLYDLLLAGDSSDDVRLLKGDTLFVPPRGAQVSVDGEVLRPALYELRRNHTLADVVSMAGGALPEGYISSVSVKRVTESGVKPFSLDMTQVSGQNFEIKNGDAVHIGKSNEALDGAVILRGEVARQGAYHFAPGMTVADLITDTKRDLKPNADLDYALVVREIDAQRHIRVLQFDLGNAITTPSSVDNLSLKARDQVFVFSNGIESEFWDRVDFDGLNDQRVAQKQQARRQAINAANGQEGTAYAMATQIDPETGAEVSNAQQQTEQKLAQVISERNDEQERSLREQELEPIIERLKEQANNQYNAAIVELSGAVKYPGVYPLPKNASLEQLLAAAGGLTEAAYLKQAEITRREVIDDRLTVRHYPINVADVLNGKGHALNIRTQDRINIKTKPNWHKNNTIELQGEIRFPGVYAFERGETIQDVIERAGGLTEFAYPKGAVFSRERLKRQERERLKMLNRQLKQEISSLALRRQTNSAQYTTSPSDALSLADELQNAEAVGRMVISLPRALEGDEVANIMLESGDKLYVPPKNPVVSIMGEVQFASNQLFEPGMTVSDYIESAGGTKQQADTDRIYVVRADGSVMMPNNSYWFSRQQEDLEPGDTIIVPIDTDYLDGLSTASTATQILYQLGVAWQAVKD